MIPKKLTESEWRGALERILKTPEHIHNLTSVEAKEFLSLVKEERKKIMDDISSGSIDIFPHRFEEKYHLKLKFEEKFPPGSSKSYIFPVFDLESLGLLNKIIEMLEARIKILDSYPPKKILKKKEIKSFPDYLIFDQKEILAERLKKEFNTEVGKEIRLMIDALISKDMLPETPLRQLYKALNIYFNRYIGTYESIRKIPKIYEIESYLLRIDFILKEIYKRS